jgi:hypothetical protein
MATRSFSLLGFLLGCASLLAQADEAKIDFSTRVRPILEHCVVCHQSGALFGNVNLENAAMAFRNRPGGPAILRGRPDSSPLYQVLKLPPKDPKAMPPSGHRIADREMETLYQWVKEGAEWPTGAEGVVHAPASNGKGK